MTKGKGWPDHRGRQKTTRNREEIESVWGDEDRGYDQKEFEQLTKGRLQ